MFYFVAKLLKKNQMAKAINFFSLETYPFHVFLVKAFVVTVADQHGEHR
jgi:hypothetical protein